MYRLLSRYTALWQKICQGFSFCLGFRGRIFFLVVAKKNRVQKSSKNLAEQSRHGTAAVRGTQKSTHTMVPDIVSFALRQCVVHDLVGHKSNII